MPNYNNGKVYKLCNNIDDLIYIGSTICTLSAHMALHHLHAKKNYNVNLYKHMNKLGIENFKIVLIEDYSCSNKDQLLRCNNIFSTYMIKKYYSIQIDQIHLVLKKNKIIINIVKILSIQ